jgi:hypothetical protein
VLYFCCCSIPTFVLTLHRRLESNPTIITYYGMKTKSEAGPTHVVDSRNLPRDSRVMVIHLLGSHSSQLAAGANMVYPLAELMFILEYYFAEKSFAVAHEKFHNVYSDKKVPNKTIIHRLVTKFWDTGSVCL